MQNGKRVLLSSAFCTRADLHGTLKEVKMAMGSIPNMKPISTGTRLQYAVEDNGHEKAEAFVELTPNEVTFRFFFATPSAYDYNHNLLRFLAILAYLKGLYAVNLEGIYSYLIEALRHDDGIMAQRDTCSGGSATNARMEALNGINISLSHELSLKSARMRDANAKLDSYRAFGKEMIERLAQRSGKRPSDAVGVLGAIGIDKGLADEIAALVGVEHD